MCPIQENDFKLFYKLDYLKVPITLEYLKCFNRRADFSVGLKEKGLFLQLEDNYLIKLKFCGLSRPFNQIIIPHPNSHKKINFAILIQAPKENVQ